MKTTRSLALAIVVGTSTLIAVAGCSGKPENSPAIRKKFAELDEMKQSVGTLNAELVAMSSEIQRLTDENSELRSVLPGVDGVPALEKISTLEARLTKVEALAADRVVASASSSRPATSSSNPDSAVTAAAPAEKKPADLASAPLAGSAAAKPVAAQQQVRSPQAAVVEKRANNSFKELTKATAPAAAPKAAAQTAKPSSSRGAYHTIAAGETIDAIAAKYNTSSEKLLKANHLPSGVRLAKGQRLFVPGN